MRKLIFGLLFLVTFNVYANQSIDDTWIEKIPYYPPTSSRVTLVDSESCEIQATLGTLALHNAKYGITLEEQMESWDTFLHSDKAQLYTQDELDLGRNIIVFAWTVIKRYPEISPDDYGDSVFDACVNSKPPINTTQI